jgi:hypothetical protein
MRLATSASILLLLVTANLPAADVPNFGDGLPPGAPITAEELAAVRCQGPMPALARSKEAAAAKLDAQLLELIAVQQVRGSLDLSSFKFGGKRAFTALNLSIANAPIVEVFTAAGDEKAMAARLRAIPGATVTGVAATPGYGQVSAAIPVAALLDAAAMREARAFMLSAVQTNRLPDDEVAKLMTPQKRAAGVAASKNIRATQGIAANQAFTVLNVDDVERILPGLFMGNIWVGTLSDSANLVNGRMNNPDLGFAESQASGDLPNDGRVVSYAEYGNGDNRATDEGRGMMELIYDLVPNAGRFGYATAFGGAAAFGTNIGTLSANAMDVIVDDVRYFSEPIYQDGVIGLAAKAHIDNGGLYVGSAGNYSNNDVEMIFRDADGNGRHEFIGTDELFQITAMPNTPNGFMTFHWSERYGAAVRDLSVDILDASGTVVIATSSGPAGYPIHNISLPNTGATPVTLNIAVRGPQAANGAITFKVFGQGGVQMTEYPGLIRGGTHSHTGTEPTSSGAAYYATPATPEGFTSWGLHYRYWSPAGDPVFEPFFKPNYTCVDGCDTSFFGSPDSDGTGFPNFFGTSAAAPNSAAVMALMLAAAGGPGTLNNAEATKILEDTAIDMGAPGFDAQTGHGMVDGLAAVLAARKAQHIDKFLIPNQFGYTQINENHADTDLVSYAILVDEFFAEGTQIECIDFVGGQVYQLFDFTTREHLQTARKPAVGYAAFDLPGSGGGASVPKIVQRASGAAYSGVRNWQFDVQSHAPNVFNIPADEFGVGNIDSWLTADKNVDYWLLQGDANSGQAYSILVDPSFPLDAKVTIFDADGLVVYEQDVAGQSDPEAFSWPLRPDESYVLAVTSPRFDQHSHYNISIDKHITPGSPFYFSDTFIHDTPRVNPVSGIVQSTLSMDNTYPGVVAFTAPTSTMLLEAGASGGNLFTLTQYDSTGAREFYAGPAADVGWNENGTFAEGVKFLRGIGTPEEFSIFSAGFRAIFDPTPASLLVPIPFAPNNLGDQDFLVIESLTSVGEERMYRFDVPPDAVGTLRVAMEPAGALLPEYELYDAAGAIVDGTRLFLGGTALIRTFTATPGATYYISAHSTLTAGAIDSPYWFGDFRLIVEADMDGVETRDYIDTDLDGISDAWDPFPTDPTQRGNFCDYTEDGTTNLADALLMAIELGGGTVPRFDANRDGVADALDAEIVFRWATGWPGYEFIPLPPTN